MLQYSRSGCRTLACALLLLTATAAASVPRARADVDLGSMFTTTTDHYSVRTDVSPQFGALVAQHMEAIFKQYSTQFSDYGQMNGRFDVIVFRRRADYQAYLPAEVSRSQGAFSPGQGVLVSYQEGRTNESVLRTLYHEGFHQFMYVLVSPNAPIWLNEGIAKYFEQATWNGQSFSLGDVPVNELYYIQKAIKGGNYMLFNRLFALSGDEWNAKAQSSDQQASLEYSEAWSIVYFLIHADGGRHASMVNRVLRELSHGQLARTAVEDVFGRDYRQFENAWASYVMTLKPSPKFQCRENMQILMDLAQFIYKDPRAFRSVDELRQKAIFSYQGGWEVTKPTGEVLRSDDTQSVQALFRCPLDGDRGDSSYLLIRNLSTGLPLLVCTHHTGVVELAYYEPNGRGGYGVTVDEEVWETLPADVQQAIRLAAR